MVTGKEWNGQIGIGVAVSQLKGVGKENGV